MKNCYAFLFLFFVSLCYGQQKKFNIQWEGLRTLETELGKKEIPGFDSKHFNYNDEDGLQYVAQWDNEGGSINENSVTLSNVAYEVITSSELKNLDQRLIPENPKFSFFNTNARGKLGHFIQVSPIVRDRGTFKKIIAFTIQYNVSANRTTNSLKNRNSITNSVLSSGQWYRFYIDKSGVFQLTKNFLGSLGINTNSVDPRTIKIYGNGGRMLPLSNSENYPFDVIENAVKFVGEEDGSFDNSDYLHKQNSPTFLWRRSYNVQ